MFRKGDFSTETDKGPFIFTLIALVVGAVVTSLLFILGGGDPMAIFAGIMVAIVTVAAAAVMFALLTDKVFIKGDTLYMSYMFKRRSIAVRDIGKVTLKDEIYYVYDKSGATAGTINAKLTSVGEVIIALDRRGVNFV